MVEITLRESQPSDTEIIERLRKHVDYSNAVAAGNRPFIIHQADVYAEDPVVLTQRFASVLAGPEPSHMWYFFSRLKQKSQKTEGGKQIKRSTDKDDGVWHNNGQNEPITTVNGDKCHRKKFSFRKKTEDGKEVATGWNMHEFNLEGGGEGGNLVLCKVYPTMDSKSVVEEEQVTAVREEEDEDKEEEEDKNEDEDLTAPASLATKAKAAMETAVTLKEAASRAAAKAAAAMETAVALQATASRAAANVAAAKAAAAMETAVALQAEASRAAAKAELDAWVAKAHDLSDYICTENDNAILDSVESTLCSREKEVLVHIDDVEVHGKDMQCLFNPKGYLNDKVIAAYIRLLRDKDQHPGGKVYLEDPLISSILKQDPNSRNIKVDNYMDHDMVFIPINIKETHWYLAVVNAKKREIQVLDSLDCAYGLQDLTDCAYRRKDLITTTLKGLQKYIDQSGLKEPKKWPDLQVATWPIKNALEGKMQDDGASCGLFMINYMEYWTGDTLLSAEITQPNMTTFRKKLAAILLSSKRNKKGCPSVQPIKEVKAVAEADATMDEADAAAIATPRKRKAYELLSCSEEEVFEEDPKDPDFVEG